MQYETLTERRARETRRGEIILLSIAGTVASVLAGIAVYGIVQTGEAGLVHIAGLFALITSVCAINIIDHVWRA